MTGVRDHSELDAWKLSSDLKDTLRPVLARSGFRRHPRLHDQLTRSSEGPPIHIAEGFSRFYPSENAPFVRIARASITESIEHLHDAFAKGLIDIAELKSLTQLAKRARGATTGYLLYLESTEARDATRDRGRPTRPKRRRPENKDDESVGD